MASANSIVNDKEAFQCILEISNLLNTGLDEKTLSCCVRLCEEGVTPEALALVVKELRRQVSSTQSNSSINNNSTLS
ncbi:mitotic-spindle organizing protein 1-like [Diaphorina citri]|uniref:Mitotic-spindle organizing protein 1-like n=1 Tax=Diaphorina citri TaxID=121845 RepID=A0A1S3D3K8_DIACI|nr:mitotic-spindle organizing protein 1-like [Diaphorina citri]XP_026679881.1 mitotic-spindle organizing protein 1-like [Diaphorina citri]KAI5697996.1 hypothetical protein M8J75_000306 [Diaphorina citri]KAI5723077.1 hypothetical protein M8J76_000993 [Diaphorina citri]KAI5728149.1 hypothetical protein M8J77_012250 [Diaphorina citri]